MSITVSKLKANLKKPFTPVEAEGIEAAMGGRSVAKPSNPYQDRVDVAKSLFGVLAADVTLEEALEERRNRI